MGLTVEGVTFNGRLALRMGRARFIEVHLPCCFTDRPKKERRAMLGWIYDRMAERNVKE